jgi:hypothetical protein
VKCLNCCIMVEGFEVVLTISCRSNLLNGKGDTLQTEEVAVSSIGGGGDG